ncbi:hypothetical protein BCR34DRAFT_137037 [Clohesyomyces aquaticus]|uniref:Uncharacterized protein n=1 Tax=Clohesyomyces aquaticus TaxID=1231657 RepID=A0A1Y2A1B3_9PLEO|nr:hypothetical protein BCR34DRAFT_137037 [Clohesyomyces aquaticus]
MCPSAKTIDMVVTKRVTEIPDSEDELRTSSPDAISDIDDKPCPARDDAPQDASPGGAGTDPAFGGDILNTASKQRRSFAGAQVDGPVDLDVRDESQCTNQQPDTTSKQGDFDLRVEPRPEHAMQESETIAKVPGSSEAAGSISELSVHENLGCDAPVERGPTAERTTEHVESDSRTGKHGILFPDEPESSGESSVAIKEDNRVEQEGLLPAPEETPSRSEHVTSSHAQSDLRLEATYEATSQVEIEQETHPQHTSTSHTDAARVAGITGVQPGVEALEREDAQGDSSGIGTVLQRPDDEAETGVVKCEPSDSQPQVCLQPLSHAVTLTFAGGKRF